MVFSHNYKIDPAYSRPVAYFSMEYAIHQSLKIYAGGLGFLSGSHLRSAYSLGQNLVAIGILWKHGYYTQGRKRDQTMEVYYLEHQYHFLQPTDIRFTIRIAGHDVWVTAFYLPPTTFHTAPLFLLTTDLPENDYLAQTICHKLYDSNPEARMASEILLGEGGARLLELLEFKPDIYHLNESHGLPLAFYLLRRYGTIEQVKKHLRFTNHTPEPSGNQKSELRQLQRMGYFGDLTLEEVRKISGTQGDILDHTLTALRMAGRANGVSKMHYSTLQNLWGNQQDICSIFYITNAQDADFWKDNEMYKALKARDDEALLNRKKQCKQILFEEVANQCGVLFNPDVLTIVFARRFANYKRAELLLHDVDLLLAMLNDKRKPVQIIWAGKPYPLDFEGIGSFDRLVHLCKQCSNAAILTGYELKLSRMLKQGADVWLNTPRLTHEASGTSGMSAAMNGCVNVSIPDGWFPEFARDGFNSFVIPNTEVSEHKFQQDETDAHNLYSLLISKVIPMYYDHPEEWLTIIKNSMHDILPYFDSRRLAAEYYQQLYGDSFMEDEAKPLAKIVNLAGHGS